MPLSSVVNFHSFTLSSRVASRTIIGQLVTRAPAYMCKHAPGARRSSENRPGDAGALSHRNHHGPLQPLDSVAANRGCGQAGRRAANRHGRHFADRRVSRGDLKVTSKADVVPGVGSSETRSAYKIRFSPTWERTGLVARTVFKIAEVVERRLVGSIPTRSRQVKTLPPPSDFRLSLRGFAARRAFHYTVCYTEARLRGVGLRGQAGPLRSTVLSRLVCVKKFIN
jgi:hypothetical protein